MTFRGLINMREVRFAALAVSLAAVGFSYGCETTSGNTNANRQSQEIQHLKRIHAIQTRNNQVLKRQLASARENAKLHQEQVLKLSAKVDSLQDRFARFDQIVTPLERRLAKLESDNSQLSRQIDAVKRDLEAEKSMRHKDLQNFSEQMAKETASAINQATSSLSQPSPPPSTSGNGIPVGPGEFYQHKVERGHTLSVIAKAYKVSVSDIKRANKLDSDVIRVGQILYVPKK